MLDEMITILILLCVLCIGIYNVRPLTNEDKIFDRNISQAIKGLCSLVVILVHIPNTYSTSVQRLVGSFAYICVGIFFMWSGYGLMENSNKKGYIKSFWSKRLLSLCIPMFLVNILHFLLANLYTEFNIAVKHILELNSFVRMLLIVYLLYYVVFRYSNFNKTKKAYILSGLIFLVSIILFILKDKISFVIWPVPMIGSIFGIFMSLYKEKVKRLFANRKLVDKNSLSLLMSSLVCGGIYATKKRWLYRGLHNKNTINVVFDFISN